MVDEHIKTGWVAFWVLLALCAGWWLGALMLSASSAPNRNFADCVLEQRGTVQECAVKSGRWEK